MVFPRVHSHYRGVVYEKPYKNRKASWRVIFSYRGRNLVLLRFAEEEQAARFSDVARKFLKPREPANLDGEPPAKWTREDVLRYLVGRGIITVGDLPRVMRGYEVSQNGKIAPPLS